VFIIPKLKNMQRCVFMGEFHRPFAVVGSTPLIQPVTPAHWELVEESAGGERFLLSERLLLSERPLLIKVHGENNNSI
jgi:hypothetical protein